MQGRSVASLSACAARYIQTRVDSRELSATSARSMASSLRSMSKALGDPPVRELSASAIEDWIGQSRSSSTQHGRRVAARGFCRWLGRLGLVPMSLESDLQVPRARPSHVRLECRGGTAGRSPKCSVSWEGRLSNAKQFKSVDLADRTFVCRRCQGLERTARATVTLSCRGFSAPWDGAPRPCSNTLRTTRSRASIRAHARLTDGSYVCRTCAARKALCRRAVVVFEELRSAGRSRGLRLNSYAAARRVLSEYMRWQTPEGFIEGGRRARAEGRTGRRKPGPARVSAGAMLKQWQEPSDGPLVVRLCEDPSCQRIVLAAARDLRRRQIQGATAPVYHKPCRDRLLSPCAGENHFRVAPNHWPQLRLGRPIEAENLYRNFRWAVLNRVGGVPMSQLAVEANVGKSTVDSGIKTLMKMLPSAEIANARLRKYLTALADGLE